MSLSSSGLVDSFIVSGYRGKTTDSIPYDMLIVRNCEKPSSEIIVATRKT